MKSSIAEKWVKALRSGRYKQGKRALKTKSKRGVVRHCCLGVLCELYNKEHKNKLKVKKSDDPFDNVEFNYNTVVFRFGNESMTLPNKVKSWAGMKSYEGFIPCSRNLMELNDDGVSFKDIANTIELEHKNI